MLFTLMLTFTGLCALHPHDSDRQLWVFLVDAPDKQDYCGFTDLPAHTPRLTIPVRFIADYCEITYDAGGNPTEKCLANGDTVSFPESFSVDSQGRQVAHVLLEKETIRIPTMKSSGLELESSGTTGEKPDHMNGDEEDFRWAVGLKDVFPAGSEHAMIDPNCISQPQASGAVARINLTDGKVTSRQLSTDEYGDFLPWNFYSSSMAHTQVLTDQTRVVIPKFIDEASIELIPFTATAPPSQPSRRILIRPRVKGEIVDLAISNLPEPSISSTLSMPPPTTLQHFALYYKLVKSMPDDCPVPTTAELTPSSLVIDHSKVVAAAAVRTNGGDTFCPLVRF